MAYLALARRYRPRRFSEIVGQEIQVRALRRAVAERRVGHAYLFAGIRGVGKTTLARILAMAVNCKNPDAGDPCGACAPCTRIQTGKALDVLEMDAASHTGVDDVRELIESAAYPPAELARKVFIIDEVHMLSKSAFNALLKTLEEPPESVLFILATTEPEKVPPTVRSRCQRFDLAPLPTRTIAAYLVEVLKREGRPIEPQAARLLAEAAGGSLRDALSLADRLLVWGEGERITPEQVIEALGLVDTSFLHALSDALWCGDGRQAVQMLRQGLSRGQSARGILEGLIGLWRKLMLVQADRRYLEEATTEQEAAWLSARAPSIPFAALDMRLQVLARALAELALMDELIGAEIALLRVAHLSEIDGYRLEAAKANEKANDLPAPEAASGAAPSAVESAPEAANSSGKDDEGIYAAWHAILKAYQDIRPQCAGVLAQASVERRGGEVEIRLLPTHLEQLTAEEREAFADWLAQQPSWQGCSVRWEARTSEDPNYWQWLKERQAKMQAMHRAQALEDPHVQALVKLGFEITAARPLGKEEG